ncbi:heterokaryon incompatibility protein-domain-containing protein, partial [Schizothecium vesticola]
MSGLDTPWLARPAATLLNTSLRPSPPRPYYNVPLPPEAPRTIRLLDLEAPTRDPRGTIIDTVLAGRLRIANLDDLPSFTALSYVWGESSLRRTISCLPEVPTLEITENCHAALTQVQRQFGAVSVWVDAICINQNNHGEKMTQIPLMQDIYTKATTVFIWLGKGTESSDRAMKYLGQCGTLSERWPVSWLAATTKESWDMERRTFWKECYRDIFRRAIFLLKPLSKNLCPKDIDALLNREWASRAWTFQEMVLASHPVFLCGSHSLSWSCLLNVLSMTPREIKSQFTGFTSSKLQIDRSPGSSFQRWQKMAY